MLSEPTKVDHQESEVKVGSFEPKNAAVKKGLLVVVLAALIGVGVLLVTRGIRADAGWTTIYSTNPDTHSTVLVCKSTLNNAPILRVKYTGDNSSASKLLTVMGPPYGYPYVQSVKKNTAGYTWSGYYNIPSQATAVLVGVSTDTGLNNPATITDQRAKKLSDIVGCVTTTPPPPPATCPAGQVGTPPNCTTPTPPAPSAGWPSASNTGVPAGTTLTTSGSIDVTTAGTVIDAKDVTGCISVRASNVVIKRTRVHFTGGCNREIIHIYSGTNIVIQDSELDGQRNAECGEGIGWQNYTLLRSNVHHCTDGIRISDNANVTIKDSYVHDESALPGDHGDGIQCYNGRGGGQMTIQHNTIRGGNNAALQTADFCKGPLLFDNNLISSTGGYTFRLYANTATVTNNLWVKDAWQFGPLNTYSNAAGAAKDPNVDPGTTIVTWTNNNIVANADGTGAKTAIAQPN